MVAAEMVGHDGGILTVRADGLRKFAEVVARLGGDGNAMLSRVQIELATLSNRHAVIPFRTLARLLERASVELACPDFGMRVAAAQSELKLMGPLEYVMRNSRTVREGYRYIIEHVQVYSTAALMRFEDVLADGLVFLRIEPQLAGLSSHVQTVERSLLLAQLKVLSISSGQVQAQEIWFRHEPVSPLSTYRDYFGANVRFGQKASGLVFAEHDLDIPILNTDQQVYELATNFIAHRFPASESVFTPRIRTIVERLLLAGNCTYNGVASMLGVHPRTLQRRLRAEGESYEAIKDGVRREIALRYLKHSSMPLIRVAKMLGYADSSALSRSCYRWFSASPRQLRSGDTVASSKRPHESSMVCEV
jgi:AraC-like DNA-binding protein